MQRGNWSTRCISMGVPSASFRSSTCEKIFARCMRPGPLAQRPR